MPRRSASVATASPSDSTITETIWRQPMLALHVGERNTQRSMRDTRRNARRTANAQIRRECCAFLLDLARFLDRTRKSLHAEASERPRWATRATRRVRPDENSATYRHHCRGRRALVSVALVATGCSSSGKSPGRQKTSGVTITVALATDAAAAGSTSTRSPSHRHQGQVDQHRLGQPADQDCRGRHREDLLRRRDRRRLVAGRASWASSTGSTRWTTTSTPSR